jgi:hypothetical protein
MAICRQQKTQVSRQMPSCRFADWLGNATCDGLRPAMVAIAFPARTSHFGKNS